MSESLLDTDIVSYYLKGIPSVAARARTYLQEYGKFTISVITIFEIIHGCRRISNITGVFNHDAIDPGK